MKKRNSGERGCIILIALFLFALLMFCFSSKMFYSSEEIIVKPINEDILASYSDVEGILYEEQRNVWMVIVFVIFLQPRRSGGWA